MKKDDSDKKIRVCISIYKYILDKKDEIGLNLSKYVENALNWLYSNIEAGNVKVVDGNSLIIAQNTQNNNGPAEIRTQDLQHVRLSSETAGNVEITGNRSTSKIFQPLRADGNYVKNQSVAEFMEGKENEFLTFCLKTKPATTHKPTREAYLRALKGMTEIRVPKDVAALDHMTKTQIRALSKFHAFVIAKYDEKGFNGHSYQTWKLNQRETNYAKGSRANWKTKDLTAEEVRAGRDSIQSKQVQVFYTLLAYSGARAEHLYNWLNKKPADRKLEHINGVLRADARDTATGTKQEAYFYFPECLELTIKTYTHPFDRYTLCDKCKCGTSDRPINASSLRKWNLNCLADHMEMIYADAIQGRSAKGVGAAHYLDNAGKAVKWYPSVIPDLEKGVPVPGWMSSGNFENKPRRKSPKKNKRK